MSASVLALCCLNIFLGLCTSCDRTTAVDVREVAGTLEEPLSMDSLPSSVMEAIDKAERFHQYEIMSDTASNICVEALAEAGTTPTGGYGIVVVKGATSTTFPNLRNSRCPMAAYDKERDCLWLTTSAIEGTGVQVDWLHEIRFDEDGKAYIAHTVDPYDLQQQLCLRLGYTIDGQDVTLLDNLRDAQRTIATATNTVTDMGGFDDEQAIWIGEQISYDLTGATPRLLVTPGVKFVTGLVLTYDDMPTLTAPLTIADDGTVSIGDIEAKEQ